MESVEDPKENAYPIHNNSSPDLPVNEDGADSGPMKLVLELDLACLGTGIIPEAICHEPLLVCIEEACGLNAVWKKPEARHTDNHSRQALDNEDPAPATKTSNAVHFLQCKGK